MNDLIPREKIAGWQKLKTLVLDSVSSPIKRKSSLLTMANQRYGEWPKRLSF